jgi:hypothetical protein
MNKIRSLHNKAIKANHHGELPEEINYFLADNQYYEA